MKKVTVTPGIVNLLKGKEVKFECPNCGFKVPVYRGRYPMACPACGATLVVEESSHEDLYGSLYDAFIRGDHRQIPHDMSESEIKRDILHFTAIPLLFNTASSDRLYEALFFLTFPARRTPPPEASSLLEGALHQENGWCYLAAKACGVFPDLVIDQGTLESAVTNAKRLYALSPNWLSPAPAHRVEGHFSSERQRQILAESYGYSRLYIDHTNAVEYAQNVLLHEVMWTKTVPSSVLAPRQKGARNVVPVSGFRFQVGKIPSKKFRRLQKSIISKRNRSAGKASRVASARQMIQRRRAQAKATKWHKSSPVAARLHRGLATLLHRSAGKYESTKDGYRRMKHMRPDEMHLRLFTDGTEYHTGNAWQFTFRLDESQLQIGRTFVLKDEALSTVYHREGGDVRLPEGTEIRIVDMVPAGEWGGSYPSPPMGQYVYEVEIMSGERNGEFIEFDGMDLAQALGIDEGIDLYDSVTPSDRPTGGVYVHVGGRDVVISAFDHLLSEDQVGRLLRRLRVEGIKLNPDTNVRIYNDHPNYRLLQETIDNSEVLRGARRVGHLEAHALYEVDAEKVREIKDRFKKKRQDIKSRYDLEKNLLRQSAQEDKQAQMLVLKKGQQTEIDREKENERKEIEGLKEESMGGDAYAGGPGQPIESPMVVRDPETGTAFALPAGTQINRSNGKVLVTGGPLAGKMYNVSEALMASPSFTRLCDYLLERL